MIRAQEVEIALRRGEQAKNDRAKRARTRAARLAAHEERLRRGTRYPDIEISSYRGAKPAIVI